MEKITELSKPVAWVLHTRGGDVPTLDECYVANAEGMENIHSSPLYSQEYVSALLGKAEADMEIKARLCRESNSLHERLKAADQRIAELEAIATEYAGKFQKAQDAAKHLIIMNDSAQAEIAHLKTLLATPVRLPSPAMFDEDDSAETVISVTRARLRAQGFKVATDGATTVGDE
ncbi:Uncharacterised protein [Serratia grimesii]|uniref:hypothetical protein n=1 Tax=Serratia grimesii TaxID=82995 RepID=UPI00217B866F|nr:hypothetical protein [Serratia grimesii]CAI1502103.1 Uncharacterised protein [Serratia grimesii]